MGKDGGTATTLSETATSAAKANGKNRRVTVPEEESVTVSFFGHLHIIIVRLLLLRKAGRPR